MVEERSVPVQARSLAAREAVLAAVDPVVCRFGVDEASTSRIAAEAGVSVGTVYRYFPNKYVLFEEYIERYRAVLQEQVAVFLAKDPDLTDIIEVTRAMVIETAKCLAQFPAYAHFRLWRRQDNGELIAGPVREQGTDIIHFLLLNHPLMDNDPAVVERLTHLMIETTLTLLAQAPEEGAARVDYVDDVVLMVTSFLQAKAAGNIDRGSADS